MKYSIFDKSLGSYRVYDSPVSQRGYYPSIDRKIGVAPQEMQRLLPSGSSFQGTSEEPIGVVIEKKKFSWINIIEIAVAILIVNYITKKG